MPVFMDRHDITDLTAEAVAEAHQEDLALQHEYGVKMITYWWTRVVKRFLPGGSAGSGQPPDPP